MKPFARVAFVLAIAAMGLDVAACSGAPAAALGSARLFAQSQDVPSAADPAPPAQYAAAVDRARTLVRAAVVEQNLPGVSVAVGIGLPAEALATQGLPAEASAKADTPVWAEGFGWRDVWTRTPVTAATRFHIGTAASAVAPVVGTLGLVRTGADQAAEWSPEHIGEPEEDFPLFTAVRHTILQPLGLAPAEYPLPGDRATFYVPRSDNNPTSGRRLMRMRDLACCADGMAFSSTPSDLVRFALATNTGTLDGELAGGLVMSLTTTGDGRVVVAVTSNIAYANTAELARRVGEAFAEQGR